MRNTSLERSTARCHLTKLGTPDKLLRLRPGSGEEPVEDVRGRTDETVRVPVPGQVWLHGEYQDIFGLSVIAVAINLYFVIKAWPCSDERSVMRKLRGATIEFKSEEP